jgi:hypothetical protein
LYQANEQNPCETGATRYDVEPAQAGMSAANFGQA